MTTTGIVGSTGQVGSHILSTLLSLPSISSVYSLSRREPKSQDAKLHPLIQADNTAWPKEIASISSTPSIFFSGLGTTRAEAGGFANQHKIDHDLNIAVATAAKARGVKTFVLISAQGANSHSYFAYPKMKGDIEAAIVALGFEHTVFVRPGLIVGERGASKVHQGVFETGLKKVANLAGGVGLKDFWAQDADVIAKAAIAAGLKTLSEDGEKVGKVWVLGQPDIVRLGRTEWKQ